MRVTAERKAIMMTEQRFLVPLDLSGYADDQIVDYAIGLASQLGAHVTLLHVMQSLSFAGAEMGVTVPYAYFESLEAEIISRMHAYLERVRVAGLRGERLVVHGVPFQVILETAKTQQVTLILMGTHSRTGLRHLFLGSVAEKVVRLAQCPVLVVRQPTVVPVLSVEPVA